MILFVLRTHFDMKIIGLTKVKNESLIMKDTLDHWGSICTGGIYVYDDVSDDETVRICEEHPKVIKVIKGTYWDPDRERAEHVNRQAVLEAAQEDATYDDWFVYFDADERIEQLNYSVFFNPSIDAVACKLFDFYITPEDKDKPYREREYVGPEYRTITFFFRNSDDVSYDKPDQRIVNLPKGAVTGLSGVIRHYGKAISVDEWEKTCDYYIEHWPKYSDKWRLRKGKAVKVDMKSDFGNNLIQWHEINERGFSLERMPYGLQ